MLTLSVLQMINKIIFRAFRATDERNSCLIYKEGHIKVLKDYGITNITSNNDEWMDSPYMFCVVATIAETGETVGGIRIQVSTETTLLPVEKAISKMDARIHDIVKNYRDNGGVGELCALWNAKSVAGIGLSILLTRAGISIANQVGIKTLVGICADYTLKMFKKVGFEVDYSLGTGGEFPYPNPNYVARVLGIMNAESLESAEEYDKERMSSLRKEPMQSFIEKETKDEIQAEYKLILGSQ